MKIIAVLTFLAALFIASLHYLPSQPAQAAGSTRPTPQVAVRQVSQLIDESSATTQDPPAGKHYNDVGELVDGDLPNGQKMTEPADDGGEKQAAAKAWKEEANSPLQESHKQARKLARGSAVMVGTWGLPDDRISGLKTQEDAIRHHGEYYSEYVFNVDGSFSAKGQFAYQGKIDEGGYYSLDDGGKTLKLYITYQFRGDHRQEVEAFMQTCEMTNWGGATAFNHLPTLIYVKGFHWDALQKCYCYPDGRTAPASVGNAALVSQADLDKQVHEELKRSFGANLPFNIDAWGEDSFRVHTDSQAGLAAATQWLKDHGFYHGTGKVFLA